MIALPAPLSDLESPVATPLVPPLAGWDGQALPRERILVRRGFEQVALPVERIAWFASEHRQTVVCELNGACHMVDQTMVEVEAALDPRRFFRLNRWFLAHRPAVAGVRPAGRGRVLVQLSPAPDTGVVVGHERAAALRAWLEGR